MLLLADLVAARLAAGVIEGTSGQAIEPVAVLDAMAGCGIRALRYGLEAMPAGSVLWVNDADPDRLPLLQANLAPLAAAGPVPQIATTQITTRTAQQLLAAALVQRRRFDLVDLDAFGCPGDLVPLALEAVRVGGLLYVASTDGRSPTGHDRLGALRQLGAAARAHPASWELALRLQLGVIARAAWAQGRGIRPVLSFSEGRTFRTAVRLQARPAPAALQQLGLLAHCHGCGDQQVQPLLQLRRWSRCRCPGDEPPLAISGPLWIGALQDPVVLARLLQRAEQPPAAVAGPWLGSQGRQLLQRLAADAGDLPRCWPTSAIARCLGGGPPPLAALVKGLQQRGHRAAASGVMPSQVRSDAPWTVILEVAAGLTQAQDC